MQLQRCIEVGGGDLELSRSLFSFPPPSVEPDNKFLVKGVPSEGHLLLLFRCQKTDTHFLVLGSGV